MSTEVPPNQTIYINNLNEKIKKDELVKSLNAIFSQFGKIMEIVACKTFKLKGQAWVVFEEASAATNALRQMQGFPFYDKPMRINYAKTKSDAVAKADGTYVPKEKRKKLEERAEKKKREPQDRGSGHSYGFNSGLSRPMMPEAPAPPNSILFVTSLPHDVTSAYLQMLFGRFPGFKEVRTVETKPGIAFVEYENELQATIAKDELQNMRIGQNVMQISYAKK